MPIETILPQLREFVRGELFPLEHQFLNGPFKDLLPQLHTKRQAVKDAGWWCPQMRAEYGGMGLSLSEFGRVSEELGRSPLGHFVFNCQAPDSGNMEILAEFGTEQQRETFLLPLVAGDIRSCFSMTEPDLPGSNPTWMATTAVKEGQHYIIDGHKWFTSAADGAAFAIVMVVTNPQAEKRHDKASMIIVPTDTPGFNLVRNISVMGKQGDDYPTHCEIRYEECMVPAENLLGEEGAGFAIAQERLGPGRIHHCMRWIGICERAFSLMVARAATREVAPGRTLGMQGTIQDWIAESRAEINASRLLVLDAAARIDRHGVRKARVEVSIIKFYVAGVLQRVLDRAIQVHGALGMTDDTPLAFWYAHERAARIYDGPDEVHKMVVAREMLKAYQHEVSSARL